MHFLLAYFFLSVMSFFFSLSLHFCVLFAGSVHGLSSLEGCLSGGLSFCLFSFFYCLQGWISFISLPDGLRHLFGDHNPSPLVAPLFMCCVIYDL
jgi:hypothetical protein